jgi:PAS domain S-box-containing protein
MPKRSNIVILGGSPDLRAMTEGQRLRLLIEAVRDHAIFMLDSEGFVASWNAASETMKGYRAAEIIGQHFSVFFSAEDKSKGVPERILQESKASGQFEGEGWRIRKDGRRFWSNSVVSAVRNEQGALIGFANITRDITERMEAQEALLESERRFRLLVQGVVDYAIYMLDANGIVINWNEGAERMKGYRPDEIIGQHFSRFYTKEDRNAGLPVRVLEVARTEGRFEAEGWRVRKDGSQFWALVVVDAIRTDNGELLGFAKITRDITERVVAQRTLQESERQLRLLIQGVVDYALYMLDPNGIVTSWNIGAERIKGYTADEVIGQHFSKFYTERDRADGLPARALYTALREGRYETEAWRVRKNGAPFWAHVVIDPIRDERGKLIGFAKITRDATERRNAQIALDEANKQKAQAQKMDALGRLTGGVAHDFNNLLMVVSGYVQTVKKLLAENPKGSRAAQAIELAAQRGQALTRQLLSFAKRQPLNPVLIDLKARFAALHPMLKASVSRGIDVLIRADDGVWAIEADASEFDLAVLNITINASDAMKDGGIISITAENACLRAADTSQRLEGEFVAITVSDAGFGIPPDILERVFDPFFTTKQTGNGLGLSQVHGIVHQSGGTVTIRSEIGRGTHVTMYFPRAQESRESDASELDMRPGTGTALLVEDNPEVADASVALLEELGFNVRLARNAQEALEAAQRHTFTLVLSDIVMAGPMDGLGLARELRKRWPDLPVILVTGYSDAANAAVDEFAVLRKPYQLEDLARIAAKAMRGAAGSEKSNVVRLRD